jgi:hypothetical protein
MATTAAEQSKTRSDLAQLAGAGPVSLISILAGVLVGYATFALLFGGAVAVLQRRGSDLDLTQGWGELTARGGLLLGGLLFLSYLLGGYVAGRMAWRRGLLHGLGVFVGSIAVVGAVAWLVRSLAKPDDVEAVSDALRAFGVPTTRAEWGHAGSMVGLASMGGMLLGSVLGAFAGEHWFTKVSRRAQLAEVDVRERLAATNGHKARSAKATDIDIDIDELTKEELYQMAQELDIPGRSQMTKDELKEAVLQLQG